MLIDFFTNRDLFLEIFITPGSGQQTVKEVKPGNNYNVPGQTSEELKIFCWPGSGKHLFSLWKTSTV